MTTGESDPSMYEINPSLTDVSRLIPPIDLSASILPPEIAQATPEEQELIAQLIREGRVILGKEMLDILAAGNQPWGDIDKAIDLGVLDGGQEDQSDTPDDDESEEPYPLQPYLLKSDMSAADIAAAIQRIVRPPHDPTAVREGIGLRLNLLGYEDTSTPEETAAQFDEAKNALLEGLLPATPEQVATLLSEVIELTARKGKNYGDRDTFGAPLDVVPAAIAEHLPTPDPTSEVSHSAYIVQIFDRETGLSKTNGVVGMVTITRHEKPVPGVIYAAHANYHITTSDGGESYGLERHVTNTEHGAHMVGRTSPDLTEMRAELARVQRERPIERAMGLLTTTQTEAQQVIDLTASLINQNTSTEK